MKDDEYYDKIALEMANKEIDAGLWTKAFSLANGETDKVNAVYIKLRYKKLKEIDEEEEEKLPKRKMTPQQRMQDYASMVLLAILIVVVSTLIFLVFMS